MREGKKMYDYLVVGSGLYGAIFAHEAKAHGKSVLVVDKRPTSRATFTPRILRASTSISMVLTFFILTTKKSGTTLHSLPSSTALRTHL